MAKKPKFVRTSAHKYSKLGKGRKKRQVYRKPRGRDNKIRLNKKGRLRKVKIGFRTEKKERGLINGLEVVRVSNLEELKRVKQGNAVVIAKIGKKKRLELVKYALDNNIQILNLNTKKFLKELNTEVPKK